MTSISSKHSQGESMHISCIFACYRNSLCNGRVRNIHFPQITVALKIVKTSQMRVFHSYILLPHHRSRLWHYSGPIKERCTAEAMVQKKSSYQQGQYLSRSCIHTVIVPGNILLTRYSICPFLYCAQALSC